MTRAKPGQAVATVTMPAGWAIIAATLAKQYGVTRWNALIAELQQDTDQARIRALLQGITRRPNADQAMLACALSLGANLIVLIDEWLAEAPDDPQAARLTPRDD